MDIGIHAGQDSKPGGMAKVLEILNNSITLSEPQGTLAVNANDFVIQENEDKKHAQLIVTYKSPEGIYEPDKITCKLGNDAQNGLLAGNSVVYMLSKTGTYTLTAGALKETVTVNSNKETTSDTKKDES